MRRYWLKAAWKWLKGWVAPPDLENEEWFLQETQWSLDYFPTRDDESYDVTIEYAEGRYKAALELSESMDKKLDDLVRTSAAVGAIVATVIRLLADRATAALSQSLFFFPAIFCFAAAVVVAAWSRRPTKVRTPTLIRDVLAVTDRFSHLTPAGNQTWEPLSTARIKALLTASYHLAEVGTNDTNDWKAKQLRRATILFCLGVALLFLMLVTSPSSSPSDHAQLQSQTTTGRSPDPTP